MGKLLVEQTMNNRQRTIKTISDEPPFKATGKIRLNGRLLP